MVNPRPVGQMSSNAPQTDGLMPYVDRLIMNYYAFVARTSEPQPARGGERKDRGNR